VGRGIPWSNAANWGGSAPANNETGVELVFPALAGHYVGNNDLTGLRVASLAVTTQLSAGDYEFTGNAVTLDGPVMMASPGSGNPNLVWQIPLVLGANVTIATSGRPAQTYRSRTSTLSLDAKVTSCRRHRQRQRQPDRKYLGADHHRHQHLHRIHHRQPRRAVHRQLGCPRRHRHRHHDQSRFSRIRPWQHVQPRGADRVQRRRHPRLRNAHHDWPAHAQ
jgi:hypothetical protein